jgi:hypothetical protein
MKTKPATNWGKVAQAAHVADSQNKLSETVAQLAAERKAHAETVRTLERVRYAGRKAFTVPKAVVPTAGKGDIVEVIFSDVHGNQHDPAAFAALLGDLKILRPDRIFIGGDFINCGGFLAEHHVLGYISEADDSYEEDMSVSNQLLDAILDASSCSDIHFLEGNHEWRVERWALTQRLAHHKDVELLRRTFCAEHVLRLTERGIRYYRQGHLHEGCDTPGWVKLDGLFYVHKISNSRDAADVALSKAGGNVAYFDTHRASFKPKHIPGIGLVSAWNPGCLCKRQPLYANTRPTEWTHGYLVRFISRSTGAFSMFNVTINNGTSHAGMLLRGNRPDA